ncbi:MAG: DUF2799 domain-containing protein [Mangrovicoccus sp.]|nr:DUF2799 domain-containing protein [Mangrovicoccus sp.]
MKTNSPDRGKARWGLAALLPALALAAGCTEQSGDLCGSQDWRAVGYTDGAQGDARYSRYGSCPGFDQRAWQAGYLDGLPNYCTEARIYRDARAGLSFPKICAPMEAQLAAAHAHGARYWDLTQEMWILERRSRDDFPFSRQLARSSQYEALRRERALYSRWPP